MFNRYESKLIVYLDRRPTPRALPRSRRPVGYRDRTFESQTPSGRIRAGVRCWCGSLRPLPRVLAEPSSFLSVRQHPGADLGFQHLADFGARKVIPDFNLLGRFDAPDPLLHEGRYRGDIDGASCSRLHHSDNAFAPLLVWQTDDGTILNGFVGLKGVLNFDGIDVEAASNDHVFCAIDDVKEIVRVQVSDITRLMPAVHAR